MRFSAGRIEYLELKVGRSSAAWSDFDNDGFVDLFVSGALWRGGLRVRTDGEVPDFSALSRWL